MYVVVDYRSMVAGSYTAAFGDEGSAAQGFDDEGLGRRPRTASEEDLSAVERFRLGDFDGPDPVSARMRSRSASPAVAHAKGRFREHGLAIFTAGDDVVCNPAHVKESLSSDLEDLLDIWLRSVRVSHTFLTEPEIQSLLPSVRAFFCAPQLELWVLCADTPVGFMGLSGSVVEALFLMPEHFRRGGGTMLLDHARRLKGPLSVDVDERNPGALRFYLARGFAVVGRSLVDAAGRPFPLVHLHEVSG